MPFALVTQMADAEDAVRLRAIELFERGPKHARVALLKILDTPAAFVVGSRW